MEDKGNLEVFMEISLEDLKRETGKKNYRRERFRFF